MTGSCNASVRPIQFKRDTIMSAFFTYTKPTNESLKEYYKCDRTSDFNEGVRKRKNSGKVLTGKAK